MTDADVILERQRCGRSGCACARGKVTHCVVPGHFDEHPSMTVGTGADGRLLVSCKAKCDQADVFAAAVALLPERNGNGHVAPPRVKKSTTRYEVKDAAGDVVAVKVRTDYHDGTKDRTWDRKGVSPADLLYGLEDVAGAAAGRGVVICEGEKAAKALRDLDILAVGSVGGAATTPTDRVLSELLDPPRPIILFADNDTTGRSHMDAIGRRLAALGRADVLAVDWPSAPAKGDAVELVESCGGSRAAVVEVLRAAPPWTPGAALDEPAASSQAAPTRAEKAAKQPQAGALVRLANDAGYEFWVEEETGAAWVTFEQDGHDEHWPVDSAQFTGCLVRAFERECGNIPSRLALADAIHALSARAKIECETHRAFIRVGHRGAAVILDLCDDRWRQVAITTRGWRILDTPTDLKFRRVGGMLPLPEPTRGGSFAPLLNILNLEDEDASRMVIAFLVASLRPKGPYPVLQLHGGQGTAKSTSARYIKEIIDPTFPAVAGPPKDERDLAVAADNAWCLAFDNLSHISPALSDALCRLTGGGGFMTRTMYKNRDQERFAAARTVILTGIGEVATRGDLVDRTLSVHLPRIDDKARETEALLNARYAEIQAGVLGALCDAVSAGMARLINDEVGTPPGGWPRLADMAQWVTAAEPALGWPEFSFVAAYKAARGESAGVVLDASPLTPFIREVAEDGFSGPPSALLALLNGKADAVDLFIRRDRGWPKIASYLTRALSLMVEALRSDGIIIEHEKRTKKTRHIRIYLRDDGDDGDDKVTTDFVVSSPGFQYEIGPGDDSDDINAPSPTWHVEEEVEGGREGGGESTDIEGLKSVVTVVIASPANTKTSDDTDYLGRTLDPGEVIGTDGISQKGLPPCPLFPQIGHGFQRSAYPNECICGFIRGPGATGYVPGPDDIEASA